MSNSDSAASNSVYRIWHVRERVEWEAADQFSRLARNLKAIYGDGDPIARMAAQASEDEKRHAHLCREILAESPLVMEPLTPELGAFLGPSELSPSQSALYACIALSCITETLSSSLLVQMQSHAFPGIIRNTVHEILEDEISHSRLGWAELARASSQSDIRWIAPYLSGMLRDAVAGEMAAKIPRNEKDLSGWGVLPPPVASSIMNQTIREVILPGLERYGIPSRV